MELMVLMASNFDDGLFTPVLLTHNPRYLVSSLLNNDYSALIFNSISVVFCKTFSRALRWSTESYLVINIMLSMNASIISKNPNISDIFT